MKHPILPLAVLLCSLNAGTPATAAATAQPNIVYVLADQWRASATGYAGDPNVKTPNLDRLAKEALNFRNAVSVLPVCTPHRAALMTGRYPTSTGMFLNDAHLPDSELCMAEILGAAGYATAYIGKWHLDGHGRQGYIPPERRQGWDYWKVAECDHNYTNSHYYTGTSGVKQHWEGYDVFAQTKDAQQYLRDHARGDRPFVVMVAYGVPHFPHATAPAEYKALYPTNQIKLPPNVPPELQARARWEAQGYYAHCTALDKCIGDLLGTLTETGLATNTIFIFTSDHGEMLGSQGVVPLQKQVAWSESAQVPFLMRVPGISGRTVKTPVTTPDILPTLLSLAGVKTPGTVEGEDLSASIRSGRDQDRAALYMSVSPFTSGVSPDKSREYRAIRTSRYTYVRSLQGPWMLFEDEKDPDQMNNLVGKPEHATLVRELDNRLEAQLKRIGDDFRLGKNYIAEWGYEVASHGSVAYAATITKVQTPRRNRTLKTPNVIYIMDDELGYYEPAFMGGKTIKTPNLDRMAAEGIRFNNLFAGSSVCAPTRCTFLTGKHSGHASIRSNGGGTPLRADEITIASMLKPLGYAVGGFGKWGCGGRDSTGVPEKHGFDVFLGYYDQVHAHTYYPPYLIRNSEEMKLEGNNGGSNGKTYSQYVIHEAAMKFIRDHAKQPFFLYLPYTPPHGNFDIPDTDPAWALYQDQPWPEPARRYAAMVTMVDRQVGEVLALLKELGLDDNTFVLFSGDNGGADYFKADGHPRGVHSANKHPQTGVEFRGSKGNLYEGGLRVPFIARWPGKIAPGRVTDHLGYFPDLLPTIAEVTGSKAPADIDGLSLVPELIGEAAAGRKQAQHESLYWEIGGWIAIRQGNWRAVKPARANAWELYDLATDPSESKNLAAAQPHVLATLTALAEKAHEPVREGTFSRTDRHERDRRAKSGKQDEPEAPRAAGRVAAKVNLMPTEGLLPNAGWKIIRVSSENTGNRKVASNAIDGDPGTWWHTRFGANAAPPPHELVIDLGTGRTIRGFVYLGRQDTSWNGAIKDVEFCVSATADQFGAPVAKTALAKTKEPQTIKCPETKGRYVLLRALTEHGGGNFASVAELGILGE